MLFMTLSALSGMNLSGRRVCRRLRSGLGLDITVAMKSGHRKSYLDDRSLCFSQYIYRAISCNLLRSRLLGGPAPVRIIGGRGINLHTLPIFHSRVQRVNIRPIARKYSLGRKSCSTLHITSSQAHTMLGPKTNAHQLI